MARRGIPIATVEYDARIYGYLSVRFLFNSLITLAQNDSRAFLNDLASEKSISKQNVFFYLDAHWNEDLPLAEELTIIFSNWKDAIVMVDDFKVPNTDYGYDDYGPGKALTLDYLSNLTGADEYNVFFPAVDESQETGKRRGSVVICNSQASAEILLSCSALQHHRGALS